ncbi:hypothetical protein HDIA_0985 [Hartmannibacter diazotrophicus]|uniref:Uncharacterized protein n=1 Tax=Hartmannibacter diazotrophicus TaxID=1482074 RepID=A0A2C9D2N4_9HYPH|nr:hypothetical protein HDIA_0985 [Hartmannibacter diazotrophicus]
MLIENRLFDMLKAYTRGTMIHASFAGVKRWLKKGREKRFTISEKTERAVLVGVGLEDPIDIALPFPLVSVEHQLGRRLA